MIVEVSWLKRITNNVLSGLEVIGSINEPESKRQAFDEIVKSLVNEDINPILILGQTRPNGFFDRGFSKALDVAFPIYKNLKYLKEEGVGEKEFESGLKNAFARRHGINNWSKLKAQDSQACRYFMIRIDAINRFSLKGEDVNS